MAKWPKGIRPSGNGIRVTVWHKGQTVYDKTHSGSPYSPSDLKACVELREDLVSRLRLGLPIGGESSTRRYFSSVAQSYLDSVQVDSTTHGDYRSKLNAHCMPYLKDLIFEEITRQQISDMVARWKLKASSKRAVLRVLGAVFRYGGRDDNPTKVRVGQDKVARMDRYKPDERDALINALTGHSKTFFAIFFGTGMRPGEILALEWADYDGASLYVGKQYTRGVFKDYTKTKRDRTVYVPQWVREILNAHDTRLEGGRLFSEKRPTRFYKAWRKAHDKARVGAHPIRYRRPYACRHTRAAELLSVGVIPAQAARELGHSPLMFLRTYAEFVDEFCNERDFDRLEGYGHSQKTRKSSAK